MEAPSQLEKFISSQRHDGQVVNEGAFTLAREKALQKLANYQLPFDGAWAVKVIQSAVSCAVEGAVRVDQTGKETRFYFACHPDWTLDQIEESFFQAESTGKRSINHLISALWVVGVKDKRAFQLTLPWEEESLVWDGETIHRAKLEEKYDTFFLGVSHFPGFQSKVAEWVVERTKAGKLNAEVSRALAQWCFASPRQLTIDGRRIDGLQFTPKQGWGENSFPIGLRFCSGDSPTLEIPPGTLEGLDPKDQFVSSIGGVRSVGDRALAGASKVEAPALGVMLSAHAMKAKTGKRTTWETTTERSRCYWLLDGAVVEIELLTLVRRCCSVALFVSAEGLKTDLSGFSLSVGEEKSERLKFATRTAFEALQEASLGSLQDISSHAARKSWGWGGLLALTGLCMSVVTPAMGIPFWGIGLATVFRAGVEEKEIIEEYRTALGELLTEWKIQFVPSEEV